MAQDAGAEEIRQLARTYQYDRYVAALLLPRRHRDALVVLAAFAGELQRIPFVASEPMMAAIRLQWWRDELLQAASVKQTEVRQTGHRLCDALTEVAGTNRLPPGLLQGMIDAAETELDAAPFNEAAEVRQITVKFDGALFELAGHITGAGAPREVWHEAAVAYGAARLAAEHNWRAGHGLQTYATRQMKEPADAGAAHAGAARNALDHVRERYPALDAGARGVLLPLATVEPLLRAIDMPLQQTDARPVVLSNFRRAATMLRAHWRGRI